MEKDDFNPNDYEVVTQNGTTSTLPDQNQFETKLNPQEEQKFQQWKSVNAPNDSGQDYDLRGAFKAGLQPSSNGHWPDTYKKPNHPTFSNESIYAKDAPNKAGHWEGEKFIPPSQDQTPFDPNDFEVVTPPNDKVYFQEHNKVVSVPPGLDSHETNFIYQTDVEKKPKHIFFGMIEDRLDSDANIAKGLGNFLINRVPQAGLSLAKEQADVIAQEPDHKEVLSMLQATGRDIAASVIPGQPLNNPTFRTILQKTGLADRLSNAIDKISQNYKEFTNSLNLKPTEKTPVSSLFYDIGDIGGSIAASIGLAVLTKNPEISAAFFGGLEKGTIYEEARKSGKTAQEASDISSIAGGSQAAIQYIALRKWLGVLASHKPINRALIRVATETIQNLSQQASEEAITKFSGVRNDKMTDILKRIGWSALLGAIASAPLAAIHGHAEERHAQELVKEGLSQKDARKLVSKMTDGTLNDPEIQEAVVKTFEKESGFLATDKEGQKRVIEAMQKRLTSVKEKLSPALQEKTDRYYQKYVNRFQSIEDITKRAKELGADIQPGEDPGLRARSYLGIGLKAESMLKEKTFRTLPEGNIEITGEGLKPILDDYLSNSSEQNIEKAKSDLNDYLIANRYIKDLQRPASQFDPENIATEEQIAESKSVIQDLNKKYGDLGNFEQTSSRLYEFQQRILHTLVDAGNLSQEQYENIVTRNPNYVPFERVFSEEEFSGGVPSSKNRFTKARAPIKKIKGSEREVYDVIESTIKNVYKTLNASERNSVARSVARLGEVLPEEISPVRPLFQPIQLSDSEVSRLTEGQHESIDISTGEKLIFRPSPFAPKGNIVEYYDNGKKKYVEVNPNLHEAMTGINETSLNIVSKILSVPANWLRTGATLTPEFMARNPIRDQFTAFTQTQVGFVPFVDTFNAIGDIIGKKEIYNDWIRSGAAYSGFVELSRKNLKSKVNELIDQPDILKSINIIAHAQNLSQLFEQATRLAVFKRAKGIGQTDIEAGFTSRESTVDFARRGTGTKDINAMVAFFNAGIQGVDRTMRSFREDPKGMSSKAFLAVTVPSIVLYLKNRLDPMYKEIPRWERDLFWVTRWPGSDTFVRIPKPFFVGQVFGTMPERFLEFIESKDKTALDGLGKTLYDSISPVSGDPASGLMATGIKPLIEWATNYNFFTKRPIIPDYKKQLLPSEQFNKGNTETSKFLGKKLNMSPAVIENLARGYFGGSGRYALEAGDLVKSGYEKLTGQESEPKKPIELSDIPLIKGFVSKPIGAQSESINQFYNARKEIDALYLTYRKMIKEGRKEEANKLLETTPSLKEYKNIEKIASGISDVSKEIDSIINKKISDDEKRYLIEKMELKKISYAKKGLEMLNK